LNGPAPSPSIPGFGGAACGSREKRKSSMAISSPTWTWLISARTSRPVASSTSATDWSRTASWNAARLLALAGPGQGLLSGGENVFEDAERVVGLQIGPRLGQPAAVKACVQAHDLTRDLRGDLPAIAARGFRVKRPTRSALVVQVAPFGGGGGGRLIPPLQEFRPCRLWSRAPQPRMSNREPYPIALSAKASLLSSPGRAAGAPSYVHSTPLAGTPLVLRGCTVRCGRRPGRRRSRLRG
jgi:hypothetical protein